MSYTHMHTYNITPLHITPASSLWSHPLTALLSMVQLNRSVSSLVHSALDKWTGPFPSPKNALLVGIPLSIITVKSESWYTIDHSNSVLEYLPRMHEYIIIAIHHVAVIISFAAHDLIIAASLQPIISITYMTSYYYQFSCTCITPDSPSCLHTVVASLISHPSSHTVPQKLSRQTSTLPLSPSAPSPASLNLPSSHSS